MKPEKIRTHATIIKKDIIVDELLHGVRLGRAVPMNVQIMKLLF